MRTSETNVVFAVTSEGSNPNALKEVYGVYIYIVGFFKNLKKVRGEMV